MQSGRCDRAIIGRGKDGRRLPERPVTLRVEGSLAEEPSREPDTDAESLGEPLVAFEPADGEAGELLANR